MGEEGKGVRKGLGAKHESAGGNLTRSKNQAKGLICAGWWGAKGAWGGIPRIGGQLGGKVLGAKTAKYEKSCGGENSKSWAWEQGKD